MKGAATPSTYWLGTYTRIARVKVLGASRTASVPGKMLLLAELRVKEKLMP
jgi:hypothetical protein